MLVATWGLDALLALAPPGIPRLDEVSIDFRALVFAGGVSLLVCLLTGLFPAIYATRMDLRSALHASGRGVAGTRGRMRSALVVAQLRQETERENMRVSVNKYKLQAALFADALQTQATLADADYQYQEALLAFWTAKAEYEKAIGADK